MRKKSLFSLLLAGLLAFAPVMDVMADNEEEENTEEEQGQITSLEDANKVLESFEEQTAEETEDSDTEDAATEDEEEQWEEFIIGSVEDLKTFSRNCWLDTWSQNRKVYLTADLDLTGSGFVSIPTFGGYFNGQGHTISGLSITDSVSYAGLFSYTQRTAVIADLNVKGEVSPSGDQMAVGGIVGENNGILVKCTFNGTVEGNDYTGGIAGFNELTGVIIDCTSKGNITGVHYTGGIAGENKGNIAECVNEAEINTSNIDTQMSLDDINLEQYASNLLSIGSEGEASDEKSAETSAINNTVDTGGIAGLSTGIIQGSTNKGKIGYEHVGYNIGGIVGRQSGYVWFCENAAPVYGRKDVGGIAGQAEPYVAVDLSEDIAYQLTDNINELHDLIDKMLEDTGAESETISNRLSVIQSFTSKALDDTSFLADRTVEWADGMVGSANEIFNRTDFIMDELAKESGPIDDTKDAAGNVKDAAENLGNAVEDLNIYDYMTPDERASYDSAKQNLEDASRSYSEAYADYLVAAEHYYIAAEAATGNYEDPSNKVTEDDLKPYRNNDYEKDWTYSSASESEDYIGIEHWGHIIYKRDENGDLVLNDSGDPEVEAIYVLGRNENPNSAQNDKDRELLEKVAEEMQNDASDINSKARIYAEKQHADKYGGSYDTDMADWAETMTNTILTHTDEMSDNVRDHVSDAVSDVKDAAGNLESAGDDVKNIFNDLNDRSDIVLPQLGSDYRSRTSSLAANLQGISENMGYLNGEMLSTSDVMVEDLEAINDQFSSIMLLYTDAVDGVLDMDYSTAFEDTSEEDAEESTDATIADSLNAGEVKGDINIAGIAGTMAIEYDFDLESDVTGIEDAKANSTFLTKCVLRENENRGAITAQKSYAGGITGLQEMGMILRCADYGKVKSTSGDYVGGIAGQSLSFVKNSFAKCTVSGGRYVAGVTGYGYRIEDCYAMVKVKEAEAFFGAIAGEVDGGGNVFNNYFVSGEIAGIDRISYSGKAEPVSYQKLMEAEGIPDKFRMMTITFYADDEEIKSIQCRYGGNVSSDKYPDIPMKKGFYADWDKKELLNVMFDQDVTVEYVRYLTTLAGSNLRENGQSVILVDGTFEKSAIIDVRSKETADVVIEDVPPEDITEHWTIMIPDDGNAQHQIRYQAPQGETENVVIYVKKDGAWQEAETELMGIYHLFTVDGTEAEIAVSIVKKEITDYLIFIIPGAAVLITLIVLLAVSKKNKGKAKKKEKIEEKDEEKQDGNKETESAGA